jgi:UDP-N-acetylmuramate dehydrogenase
LGLVEENQAKIRTLLTKRHETQPIGLPSCGSVFRNPPGDYAGRLIEQAGWKGKISGGAYVSEKHANFIINGGQATAADIETLIGQIRESVQQNYGIELITEVHIVGQKLKRCEV